MARILVVDDEPRVRTSLARMLERSGHTCELAGTPEVAFRIASERPIDVTIVDYHLGTSDGVAVLQRLRELQPGALRMLMSGRLELPTIIQAVNHGEVQRVIGKPIGKKELNEAVSAVLQSRENMRRIIEITRNRVAKQQREHLEECLAQQDLMLAVQPIVDASTGQPVAYECLLRSRHPVLTGPLHVLTAAESHGMLGEISTEVIRRAVEWLDRLPAGIKLFINVHPDELADGDAFLGRLEPLRPVAERIVLEITERNRLHGINDWERVVDSLTDAGFALAVDDLGAGYSSLSTLAELQPAYVKVDMSIVRNIDSDPRKQRLVDLLVRFADATDATLVAEGVETEAEATALRACGAHLLQGYLFGRPALHDPESAAAPAAR